MNFAIIGTGALGGYYGSLLAKAGKDVHFLLHHDYEYVKENGLVIDSVDGNFSLPRVNAYKNVKEMPLCDVVIVALKTTQNHLLQEILPSVLKEDGCVLVLQNGLGIEEQVADIVGQDRVMGGLCFLCSNKISPGRIHHMDYGHINMGDYSGDGKPKGITERLSLVGKAFSDSGIQVNVIDDLITARWQKLVWNIPYNGLSVIFHTTTDKIMNHYDSRTLVEKLMMEVIEASKVCGHSVKEGFADEMIKATEKMASYKPSMLLDYDKHVPLEVDAIYGRPLELARKAGYNMTCTEVLYRQLKFLDELNVGNL
jgi:2-dehydropantoate 2-reductase